jgi:pentatricopeptide repeat protein
MVELLGRAGDFTKVKKLLEKMPMRGDAVIWSTLLGACLIHSNLELGKQAFQQAVCSDQMDVAAYVFMSNVYAGARGNSSLYDIADSC